MDYLELTDRACAAFCTAVHTFQERPLESDWGAPALGWHELLDAEHAGVYASCDGIVLLNSPCLRQGGATGPLIDLVYRHHVRPMFDRTSLPSKGVHTVAIREQVHKAQNISFKLARFLEASAQMADSASDPVVLQSIRALCDMQDSKSGWFRMTPYGNPNLTATALAVKALLLYRGRCTLEVQRGLLALRESLDDFAAGKHPASPDDAIIAAIWTCSQLPVGLDDQTASAATNSLARVLTRRTPTSDWMTLDELIRDGPIRDHLSLNCGLLLGSSILNSIKHARLDDSYICFAVPLVDTIVGNIESRGFYSQRGDRDSFRFWEQYFALKVLEDFVFLIRSSNWKKRWAMLVHPTLFPDGDHPVDPTLGAVIMPFEIRDSAEIYGIMQEAADGFRLWRADDETTGKIIINDVWSSLNRARFIIADCSGRNANVFYELGIAHTLGKPVFLCAQSRADFPFDVAHIRSYVYGLRPGEVRDFKNAIADFVKSM